MRYLSLIALLYFSPLTSNSQGIEVDEPLLLRLQQNLHAPGDSVVFRLPWWSHGQWEGSNLISLKTIVGYLNVQQDLVILIAYHTDCRGTKKYNLEVSKMRAEDIQQRMILEGLPPDRIQVVGRGEEYPAIKCNCEDCSETDHQSNRRIELSVIEQRVPTTLTDTIDIQLAEGTMQLTVTLDVCIDPEGHPIYIKYKPEDIEKINQAGLNWIISKASQWKFMEAEKSVQCGTMTFKIKEDK